MRIPTPNEPRMTMPTRTMVASMSRYSASPPQTPPMTRLLRLRSRRPDTQWLPSDGALVGDREEHRSEGGDRDGWLGRELTDRDDALGRSRDERQHETGRSGQIEVAERIEGDDRDRRLESEAGTDQRDAAERPRRLLGEGPVLGRGRERRCVEGGCALIALEPQGGAQGALAQGVRLIQLIQLIQPIQLIHVVHTPAPAIALRSSCRARRSCTPTVDGERP